MVSFWFWRSDDSSPASFEKTLSALSAKITDTQARLDALRARSRRIRVLWTLYLSFAYLVYTIVIILVVGSNKMGPYEWTAVSGGPVVIYVTRTTLAGYYTYRIDSLSAKLKDQQSERAKTIQKLKDATKYDTTLELLEKYGGESRPKSHKDSESEDEAKETGHGRKGRHSMGGHSNVGTPGRTGLPPPPTANIQRRLPAAPPPGPQNPDTLLPAPSTGTPPITEEFAPNAFSQSPPPPPSALSVQSSGQYETPGGGSNWYDRVLDLLLGEDEMAAKNRIVLICQRCRLVNGQAPPGTKRLSDMGMWKCMGCGAMNGEIDEGKKLVREVLEARKAKDVAKTPVGKSDEEGDSDDPADIREVDDETQASSTTKDAAEFMAADAEDTRSGGARRRKGKK
ncbi:hypothetical protein jhhlp_000592 [Lomentospora prolificans]|uniref:Endoplasmic reticulum junction formation protein lunapark n=1 Tax=Lomentospora prolificans TaxID=41688 RepID=A0A2N3NIZ4_9PEZI|nr:hypothetical protein jhhlp_000592 [Lomentospora prolificans]